MALKQPGFPFTENNPYQKQVIQYADDDNITHLCLAGENGIKTPASKTVLILEAEPSVDWGLIRIFLHGVQITGTFTDKHEGPFWAGSAPIEHWQLMVNENEPNTDDNNSMTRRDTTQIPKFKSHKHEANIEEQPVQPALSFNIDSLASLKDRLRH